MLILLAILANIIVGVFTACLPRHTLGRTLSGEESSDLEPKGGHEDKGTDLGRQNSKILYILFGILYIVPCAWVLCCLLALRRSRYLCPSIYTPRGEILLVDNKVEILVGLHDRVRLELHRNHNWCLTTSLFTDSFLVGTRRSISDNILPWSESKISFTTYNNILKLCKSFHICQGIMD